MSVAGISDNANFDMFAYSRQLRARTAETAATSSTNQARPDTRAVAATEIISSAHEGLLSKMEEAGISSRPAPSTSVAAALEAFSSF